MAFALLVAEYLDIPLDARAGGVRTYISSVSSGLRARGHDVVIADGSGRPRLFLNRRLMSPVKDADINHFHEPSTALLACRMPGTAHLMRNVLVTFHAPVSDPSLAKMYEAVLPFIYRHVRIVMTATERNASYLRGKGLNPIVSPLWADGFFSELPPSEERGRYLLSVCVVDRFHKYKNYGMISMIAKGFSERYNLRTKHVGKHDFGLTDVEHIGFVSRAELRDVYRKALVVILPSVGLYEGFGLVAAEALACGTPVLVSEDAGIGEYLDPIFVADSRTYCGKLEYLVQEMLRNPANLIEKSLNESRKFGAEVYSRTIDLVLSAGDSP